MGKIKELLLDLEVGKLEFDGRTLEVYKDLNEPLFLVSDVIGLLGYNGAARFHIQYVVDRCEMDEVINTLDGIPGPFVTELGLYSILSQETGPLGRKWRRVIHDEIVRNRKKRSMDILAQFEEWDHELDTLYIDEETGILMQSVTVAGGDVDQVPYKPERSEGLFGASGE